MSPRAPTTVLVVDDNPEHRKDYAEFVESWGYAPVVAQGDGQQLIADAEQLAARARCPIAIVDMRLIEDKDPNDKSGLELIRRLRYTRSIVLTSFGTTRTTVQALQEYGAADFVDKAEDPDDLRLALERLATELRRTGNGPQILWMRGLSSATVLGQMFPGRADIPPDEPETLVRQLFREREWVRLTLITANAGEPSSETLLPEDVSTALRRVSRVFVAEIAGEQALQVVKLARTDKIEREAANYAAYVAAGLAGTYRPEMTGTALFYDLGAIAYRLVGFEHLDEGKARIFTRYYRRTSDVNTIVEPLRHFFGFSAWGHWYRSTDVRSLDGTLVEAYDRSWRGALTSRSLAWASEAPTRRFGAIPVELPNPGRWFVDNRQRCESLRNLRQVITHGDLHGDNLFVDGRYAWAIDFERTGYGPILRDVVELVQDLMARIAEFHAAELPLVYQLAVAICGPRGPDEALRPTRAILGHPEARKLLEVVQFLQTKAFQRAQYDDRREYLWGLLCNHLFVSTKLPVEGPRWTRAMLYAAVICERLEHWAEPEWPPASWPQVEWAAPLPSL